MPLSAMTVMLLPSICAVIIFANEPGKDVAQNMQPSLGNKKTIQSMNIACAIFTHMHAFCNVILAATHFSDFIPNTLLWFII